PRIALATQLARGMANWKVLRRRLTDRETSTVGSMTDDEEPCADHRPARRLASGCGRRRSRCWRRRRSVLGLKEIRYVPHRIDCDRLGARHGRDGCYDGVFVG